MSRLRIGLDCDGVLYNFDQYVRDQIFNRTGIHLSEEDVNCWSAISDHSPESRECFHAVMDEEACWYAGNPYPSAVELANRLAEVADVYIVTHVPRQFADIRNKWLTLNGFNYHAFIPSSGDKWREVQRYALDALIDDKLQTCVEVAEKCYTPAFLVARPWNQVSGRLPALVTRGNLEEAVCSIEAISSHIGSAEDETVLV